LIFSLLLTDDGIDEGFGILLDDGCATEELVLQKQIRKHLEALDQPYRDILFLHYLCEQSFSEIGRSIGFTKGRISQLHAVGIARLSQSILRSSSGFSV
jgi:DNA-directed RNA polymerase specialized sigma subunit